MKVNSQSCTTLLRSCSKPDVIRLQLLLNILQDFLFMAKYCSHSPDSDEAICSTYAGPLLERLLQSYSCCCALVMHWHSSHLQ